MSPGPIQLDQATALTLMLGPNGSVGIQASGAQPPIEGSAPLRERPNYPPRRARPRPSPRSRFPPSRASLRPRHRRPHGRLAGSISRTLRRRLTGRARTPGRPAACRHRPTRSRLGARRQALPGGREVRGCGRKSNRGPRIRPLRDDRPFHFDVAARTRRCPRARPKRSIVRKSVTQRRKGAETRRVVNSGKRGRGARWRL